MTSPQGTAYAGMPHRGAWLVYLNGVEVPCPQVSVTYGIWKIPEATLSFPPHRLLQRLGTEDRVEVVIFYLDDLYQPGQTPKFRLLFEGEIIGWAYTSSSVGRQMTFNAVADIAMFSQLYFFFLNSVDAIADYAVSSGAQSSGVAQAGASYPFSLFKKGLLVPPGARGADPKPPDITRPFEIIYNVVRGMVDARLNDQKPSRRAIPAVNFFSRWVRKRNFVNRFAALPLFEDDPTNTAEGVFPIIQAAQATTAMASMQKNLADTIGNAGTIWDVLKEVYGHVFFEVAMLPTAPAARVRISDGTIVGPAVPPVGEQSKQTEPVRVLNYFVKPQMLFGIAPMCNVMFPSMISNYSYAESYVVQPTRTYVNDQFIASALSQNVFTAAALSFGYPPEVDAILSEKTGRAQAAAKKANVANPGGSRKVSWSGKNLLVYPEEFYKGPVMRRMSVPAWFTYLKNREPPPGSEGPINPTAANDQETSSLHDLMASYVEYEHFRGRYEKRGGAVNMAWNPYVLPGFPCVIFDQKASSFHTVGYLSNVVQTLSLEGMSTAVNYGMSRTIPEMLDLLNNELTKLNPAGAKPVVFGSAPLEPVTSIRDIIQDFTKAETFYNALLFQRQVLPVGKKAAFDFREVIGYARTDGKVDVITLGVDTINTAGLPLVDNTAGGVPFVSAEALTEVTSQTVLVNTLSGTRDVVPLPGLVPVFNQYDTAMQHVARPICTIQEYLLFLHGGMTPKPGQVEAGDGKFGEVIYYKRIKRLTSNPDYTPTAAEVGYEETTSGSKVPWDGAPAGAAGAPQTRADWDSALVAYQAEMYSRKGPQE